MSSSSGFEPDAGVTTTKAQFDAGLKIFMTETRFTGALGGIDGATQKCVDLAAAAGLAGKFVAILGDATHSAFDTIPAGVDGPWYVNHYPTEAEMNGPPMSGGNEPLAFRNRAALKGKPLRSIVFSETGGDLSSGSATLSYWTGAEPLGEPSAENCSSWTIAGSGQGQSGNGYGGSQWISDRPQLCFSKHSLLCFQIP